MKSIDREIPATSLYCVDPPYYSKGSSLYTNFYGPSEHERVSSTVLALRHPWIVTYDDVEEIRAIYRKRRQFSLAINYSIQTKRVGSELLIASKGIRLPKEVREGTFVASDFAIAS
jgi:DNA adenine methylase